MTGVHAATTTAGDWQDRMVARGLGNRSAATVHLFESGVRGDDRDSYRDWITAVTGAKGGEQS